MSADAQPATSSPESPQKSSENQNSPKSTGSNTLANDRAYEAFNFQTELPVDPEPNPADFQSAMAENKALRLKIETFKKLCERRRADNELGKITENQRQSSLKQSQEEYEQVAENLQQTNKSVQNLKQKLRKLKNHREQCNNGTLLRQLQAEGTKITAELRAAAKVGESYNRRQKDLQFQNNRLGNDVARLFNTHETRQSQLQQLQEKVELFEIQRDTLQAQIGAKTSQINKLQTDLRETEATPPPEDIKTLKQAQNCKRLISERDNEIYMMNEMIKKWTTKFEKKNNEAVKWRRLSPLKNSVSQRRTRSIMTNQDMSFSSERRKMGLNRSVQGRLTQSRTSKLT